MARSRFVTPTTVRLDISEGDWIEIKERLDFGEAQALAQAGLRQEGSMLGGTPDMRLDLAAYKIERLVAYLVDWSFRDADGRAVDVTRASIRALDPATAAEIDAAIDAHVEAMDANPTAPMAMSTSP